MAGNVDDSSRASSLKDAWQDSRRAASGRIQQYLVEVCLPPCSRAIRAKQVVRFESEVVQMVVVCILTSARHETSIAFDRHYLGGSLGQRQAEIPQTAKQIQHTLPRTRRQPIQSPACQCIINHRVNLNEIRWL